MDYVKDFTSLDIYKLLLILYYFTDSFYIFIYLSNTVSSNWHAFYALGFASLSFIHHISIIIYCIIWSSYCIYV